MKCLSLKHQNCKCNLCNGSVVGCIQCHEIVDTLESYCNEDETGRFCEDCYIDNQAKKLNLI